MTGSIATTVTLTVTAKDANGKPVANGVRVLLATVSSKFAIGKVALSASTTFLGGVATKTFFAPALAGPFTISGTYGAAALANLLSVTATVTNTVTEVAQAAQGPYKPHHQDSEKGTRLSQSFPRNLTLRN